MIWGKRWSDSKSWVKTVSYNLLMLKSIRVDDVEEISLAKQQGEMEKTNLLCLSIQKHLCMYRNLTVFLFFKEKNCLQFLYDNPISYRRENLGNWKFYALIRLCVTLDKYLKSSNLENLKSLKKKHLHLIPLLCREMLRKPPWTTVETECLSLESAVGRNKWLRVEKKTGWKMELNPWIGCGTSASLYNRPLNWR